jgi:hypothetical protein
MLKPLILDKITSQIDSQFVLLPPECSTHAIMSRDSSVDTATGYGMEDRGFGVRVPEGSRIFSTSSRLALGVHPTSYPMGTGGSFPGGKAARAWM